MNVLTFEPKRAGTRLRRAYFEERSLLPPAAACLVASGMRERLSAVFGMPVVVRLLEPKIPTPRAWQIILREATLYRVRGTATDAIVVLRPEDASAFAAAAFGETFAGTARDRALSPFEREALERTVSAIAGTLGALCGERDREGPPVEPIASVDCAVTYFELSVEQPMEASIGIALTRDPAPEAHGALGHLDVSDVLVAPIATLELGFVDAVALAELVLGQILPIPRSNAGRGSLRIGGRTLARGVCGVRDGRYAFEIEGMAV